MTPQQASALAAADASIVALTEARRVLRASLGDVAPPPVDPPPPPPPDPGLPVLHQIAATLVPGEWRRVPTTLPAGAASFKGFQTVSNAKGSADGMGWTERLIEHKGTLMLPLMRDVFGKALMLMSAVGRWSRIESPEGWNPAKTERRPFNRWFAADGYACFAPADEKPAMGYMLRTPLDNPGKFERFGIAIGDSQMDSVGNFSMCYASDWGRYFSYTPGGKLRSWAPGESAWRDHYSHIPRPQRSSGYAGTVIYNPIRREIMATGGQVFGSNPDQGMFGMTCKGPDSPADPFVSTFQDGTPRGRTYSTTARFVVHPVTGEYLMLYSDDVIHRSADGVVWRPYMDLKALQPWGNYEDYIPWCHLSGTADVIVAVSHINGVWLHRVLEN